MILARTLIIGGVVRIYLSTSLGAVQLPAVFVTVTPPPPAKLKSQGVTGGWSYSYTILGVWQAL